MQLSFLGSLDNPRRRPYADLSGKKFGALKVQSETFVVDRANRRRIAWVCKCKCGVSVTKLSDDLKLGKVTSCGCVKRNRIRKLGHARKDDLTGQQFGKLTVQREVKPISAGNITYRCRCDCGNTTIVLASNLRAGRTQSCGCVAKARLTAYTIDGQTKTLAEWARISGNSRELIDYRLKSGWALEDAVFKPARKPSDAKSKTA
jgi:hypothetical protein